MIRPPHMVDPSRQSTKLKESLNFVMAQRTRISYLAQRTENFNPNSDNTLRTKQYNLPVSGRTATVRDSNTNAGSLVQTKRQAAAYREVQGIFNVISIDNRNLSTDWIIDINDPTRNYRLKGNTAIMTQIPLQLDETKGIKIDLGAEGNDIVMPQGKGQLDFNSSIAEVLLSVDYGFSWVNVHNGIDSVIGGQSDDFFVSQSGGYLDDIDVRHSKFEFSPNFAKGSKFFVGGSGDDFLSGGSDSDLLVGDRFNGYELYLNKEALAKNIPDKFNANLQRLLQYQPSDWNGTALGSSATFYKNEYGTSYVGLGKKLNNKIGAGNDLTNTLWLPGNDVIHGYGGDDVIYGDNNTEDNLFLLKMLKDENWKGLTMLGNDFLDGGDGNDQIFGGFGSDAIIGGRGSDFISCGDLIIAKGYTPLYGPKVVWGGEYNKKGGDSEPDVFSIGDIYYNEDQIKASNNGLPDVEAELKKIQDNTSLLMKAWNGVAFVAGAVSDVFTVVSELVGSLIEFNKTNSDTLSGAKDSDPTPTDVATIIRDFDKSDILILKLGKGSSLKTQKYTADSPVTINGQGYEKYNPLLKADNKYDGTVFTYTPTAGNSYDNIILDGYSDKLYQLGLETSGGISTYVLGGSAYAPSANNGFKFNEFNVK